ncbi:putative signal peptidase complex subunit [Trifolium repens]|nr:putative signal peptidase complex subunit [Trifolium repens]
MDFFFAVTLTDGCGFGCFSASLGSNHLRGWWLKKGQLGRVTNVVRTTPPAYVRIIVWKEAMIYPAPNAITANESSIICINCSASFCPSQSI